MTELTGQREAIADEIAEAVEDRVPRKSREWWCYFFAVKEVGPEAARKIARDAQDVQARGGMPTADGSRKRTTGGVFFALVREQIGSKGMFKLRRRAEQAFQRGGVDGVEPAEAAPAAGEQAPPAGAGEGPPSPQGPEQGAAPAEGRREQRPPVRRPEPEVEIFVRRRST